MIVVLDNLRSAHNVGSIFRTADVFGIEKLYLCGITPGPLDRFNRANSKVAKVSLGAEKSVPWEHVKNTGTLIARLRDQKYFIIALEQDKRAKPPKKILSLLTRQKSVVLVLGAEVVGLKSSVLKRADAIMEIHQFGKKESLNVSVAFGIAAYTLQGAHACPP